MQLKVVLLVIAALCCTAIYAKVSIFYLFVCLFVCFFISFFLFFFLSFFLAFFLSFFCSVFLTFFFPFFLRLLTFLLSFWASMIIPHHCMVVFLWFEYTCKLIVMAFGSQVRQILSTVAKIINSTEHLVNLTLTLLNLFREIASTGPTCSMQRVKEKFYLYTLGSKLYFLKWVPVSTYGPAQRKG